MIEINLLPGSKKKEDKNIMPFLLGNKKVVKGLIAGLGIVLVSGIIFVLIYPVYQRHLVRVYKEKWTQLETQYDEYLKLKKKLEVLQNRAKLIKRIREKRILWAAIMNYISDALPSSIQLIYLGLEQDPRNVESKYALVIEGVVPLMPGEKAIEEWIRRLKDIPQFNEVFPTIVPPSTYTDEEGNKRFTLKCYLSSKYIQEEKAEKIQKSTNKKRK